MTINKSPQKRIARACRKYKKKMQSIVDGPGIESISIQVGNGPKIVVAGKEGQSKIDKSKATAAPERSTE